MEWMKLIGIVIIVVGFVLGLDTIATIIIAGLATALVSGMNFLEFLEVLGKSFVDQRVVSIFFLTLPILGLAESYGLKQGAVKLIEKLRGLTMPLFISLYLLIRELAGLLALRLGGHAQFVRPIVYPMAEAAAQTEMDELDEEDIEEIKGLSAANENFGNFFAQNTYLGNAGVLLISGTLIDLGYKEALPASIAKASIPAGIAMLVVGIAYNYYVAYRMKQ
ncbi:DUF969 domain-containing protein [Atopobacter sp. AH10]|uniref:5-oxoproline transporter, DUF969 family subunit n=1 Tax=Atopobacter sp. AH10 TaxID=2315861 RepID=UPI000EF1AEBC|nr:DUF969 family protein [Atopobacter sp. AH10]RLK62586.1 DUF969 domain-containing protein [Atopobacter sp. AH10]